MRAMESYRARDAKALILERVDCILGRAGCYVNKRSGFKEVVMVGLDV